MKKNNYKRRIEALAEMVQKNMYITKDTKKYNWVNPPPKDRRCMCCGKHISELKPFDGTAGAILVKNFRRLCVDYQVDAVWECRDCIGLNLEEFNEKHKQYLLQRKE